MSRPASAEAAALILVVALHYRDASGAGFADSIEQAERLLDPFWHRDPATTADEFWAAIFAEFDR